MSVQALSLQVTTQGNADIIDITEQVTQGVAQTGMKNGIITIFCPSSTSALTTIEYEAGALTDLRRLFDEIVDPKRHYAHDAAWHARRAVHVIAGCVPPCAPC